MVPIVLAFRRNPNWPAQHFCAEQGLGETAQDW